VVLPHLSRGTRVPRSMGPGHNVCIIALQMMNVPPVLLGLRLAGTVHSSLCRTFLARTHGPRVLWTSGPVDLGTHGPWNPWTLWTPGSMDLGTCGSWNPWTWGLMDSRTREPWDPWTPGLVDPGTCKPQDPWTQGLMDPGTRRHKASCVGSPRHEVEFDSSPGDVRRCLLDRWWQTEVGAESALQQRQHTQYH